IRQRPSEKPLEPRGARAAEHDLRDVLAPGLAQNLAWRISCRSPRDVGAESCRELECLLDPPGRVGIARLPPNLVEMGRDPAGIKAARRAAGDPHDGLRLEIGADADQDAFRRRPWPLDGVLTQI